MIVKAVKSILSNGIGSYNLTHILSKTNSLVYFKHSVLEKINYIIIFETKYYLDPDLSEMVQGI